MISRSLISSSQEVIIKCLFKEWTYWVEIDSSKRIEMLSRVLPLIRLVELLTQ